MGRVKFRVQSRCAGLLGEERLPLPEHWTLRILQLGNHGVGLNVINHWNKHRIRLFLEAVATLQAYGAIALYGCSPLQGFLSTVISIGFFRTFQGCMYRSKEVGLGEMAQWIKSLPCKL